MEVFKSFVSAIGTLPDWLSLLAFPILLLPVGVAFWAFGKKSLYLPVCLVFSACGFTLVCCEGEARYAFVWLGLFAAECVLVRGIFFIPKRKREKKRSKAEKIYEKFHMELEGEAQGRTESQRPPKISCYPEEISEEDAVAAEDAGLRLSHASDLLARLRTGKLSAGDRLETDVLARTLETFRNKRLTSAELDSLNDCLASVLKLTAKYSL